MRGEAFALGLFLLGCHDPSTKDHPSPQETATPPVPPSPAIPTGVTTTNAAQTFAAEFDASPQVRDGAVACTVILEHGPTNLGVGPDYRIQNTGNLGMRECAVVFYAYDKNGVQLARVPADPFLQLGHDEVLQPAESVRAYVTGEGVGNVAKTPDVRWEAVVTQVKFADGSTWSDPSRAPPQRKSTSLLK